MRAPILIALTTLVLSSGQAAAEVVDHIKTEYQPLVNTQAGRIESCGFHFSTAVRTLAGRILIVKGSVNSTFWKEKMPGILVKLTAFEFKGDVNLVPLKVHYASMRVNDMDTRSLRQFEGDDGAILLLGNLVEHERITLDFPANFALGAWVSFSLDKTTRDYNFRLPEFGDGDDETFQEYMQCSLLGMEEQVKEMKALTE